MSEFVDATGKVNKLLLDDVPGFIERNKYIVLDFYADWCQPCKDMAPIFEQLAEKYKGTIAFGKVDCEEDKPRVKAEYKIKFIPTFFLFRKRKLPLLKGYKEHRFSATKTLEEFSEIFDDYFKLKK